MSIHFIRDVKSRKEALSKIPITPCKMVKVTGGYAWFDFMTDYEMWRHNK